MKKITTDNSSKTIIFGGPPCQPFSKNGYWVTHKKRQIEKDPRNLIDEFLKVVNHVNADGFLIENVESILHPVNKHVADQVMLWGYNNGFQMKCFKLNAYDYGVPQKRKRIFFIAYKTKNNKFKKDYIIQKSLNDESKKKTRSIRKINSGEAIKNFAKKKYSEVDENIQGTYREELTMVPIGGNYLHLTEKKNHPDPRFIYGTRFWNFLLKLDPNKPSWTIPAQPGKWTGPFHWEDRRLRVPELAALQSFPSDFKFYGNRRSIQMQIGNAVPPKLASHVLEYLKKKVNEEDT
jgi:DNA (cytosine-5)-methyltransferase 1